VRPTHHRCSKGGAWGAPYHILLIAKWNNKTRDTP